VEMLCIEGLQTTLMECYQRGILPAEHNQAHWAQQAAVVTAARPELTLFPTPRRTSDSALSPQL
jgi:hypothetical protein